MIIGLSANWLIIIYWYPLNTFWWATLTKQPMRSYFLMSLAIFCPDIWLVTLYLKILSLRKFVGLVDGVVLNFWSVLNHFNKFYHISIESPNLYRICWMILTHSDKYYCMVFSFDEKCQIQMSRYILGLQISHKHTWSLL